MLKLVSGARSDRFTSDGPASDGLASDRFFSGWLTAPGRQALTLYVAHILIGMGILDEMGLLDGSLSPQQIFQYSLGFCAAAAIHARLWALIAKRGPLEALMRRLTG